MVRESLAAWWAALLDPARAGELIVERRVPHGFDGVLVMWCLVLLAVYGASMGLFNGTRGALYAAVKLPLLYGVTLFVCFPALYAANTQLGPRLRIDQTARLLLMAISANVVALASYAPVSYFFVLTTSHDGYGFLVLMHVGVFVAAGAGTVVVATMLFRATCRAMNTSLRLGFVLSWGVLYGLVASHASWVLRPWIGARGIEYTFLRAQEGSFLEAVGGLLRPLLSG